MATERLNEIEKAVKHHPDPVVSASEIAEQMDVTRRTVLDELRLLERAGDLESKEVGARSVAWWHVERVVPAPPRDPADHPDQRALEDTARSGDRDDGADGIEDVLKILEIPGTGRTLEKRKDAVRACYELLRREGEASKSDYINTLYDEHRAGYRNENGWWNVIGKRGLRGLAEHVDEIEPPAEGEHLWYWDG